MSHPLEHGLKRLMLLRVVMITTLLLVAVYLETVSETLLSVNPLYFLIVVTVGGTSSLTGPFVASLLLGIADVAGKYYLPAVGAFVIYTLMIVFLLLRPQGLFARAR